MGSSDDRDEGDPHAGAAHRLALREREALMAEAEAVARVGSYLWEPGKEPVWSDGMFRVLGYEPGSVAPGGEAFFARVHPDDVARLTTLRQSVPGGGLPDVVYRVLRADTGELRYLRGVGHAQLDPQGSGALRMVGALMDVTDSRVAALRNEQSLATLRAAERLAHIGSFALRPQLDELSMSDGLLELLGSTVSSDDPARVLELVHPDDRERCARWWGQLLARKSASPIQLRIQRTDGELRHVLTHAAVLRFESDGMERVLGTVVDVTERVQLDEQLRHAAKMEAVGALAAGVAHDFNNYLMVISGSLELMAHTQATAAEANRELMDHANHAVARCMELTQQLLAFGRRKPSRSEVVDLRHEVGRTGALLQPTLGRGVRIEHELSARAVRASIDPSHLEQVVANLMINARDAVVERGAGAGRVLLRVEHVRLSAPLPLIPAEVPAGRWARIEVSDDGAGIAPEHLARIFDPYFTTKALGRGTGLGLSSVYGAVSQHGGYVTVHSVLGHGTTLSVWLPAASHDTRSDPPPALTSQPESLLGRVLLVDDMPEVRHVAALTLRGAGFDVIEASDGLEALAQLEVHECALVLSDVRMPRMDGIELAARLAERWPTLPVLLMSGFSDVPEAASVRAVLDKPIAAERLVAEVRRHLRGG